MYWNPYDRPGYKIPVRRAPIGGASPYSSRHSNSFTGEETPAVEQKPPVQPAPPVVEDKPATTVPEAADWQGTAQRLQADMDNFRKRQTRRADEAIAAERERLLRSILPLADNLSRALNYSSTSEDTLRQGVELTRRELLRLLEAEGVSKIVAVGQPFTPELHEAVAVIPAQAEPNTVIEEVEGGYLLGDKLLRPAKVVVAA